MKDLLAHQPLAGEDVMRGDVFEGLDHPPSVPAMPCCDMSRARARGPRGSRASERTREGRHVPSTQGCTQTYYLSPSPLGSLISACIALLHHPKL